jgi:hypothetical protein
MGLNPGSPGERLAGQIRQGQVPRLSSGEWIRIMGQSGVDSGTAATVLRDHAGNRMYMTPDIVNAVRQSQFQIDVARHVPKLPAGASKAQQIQHQGALNHLARSRGYTNWAQFNQLHGQPVRDAGNIMQQIDTQAEQSKQLSPYGRGGPLTRTLDVVRNATPETGIKDLVTRGVLNVVPQSTLPKASISTSMAKGLS